MSKKTIIFNFIICLAIILSSCKTNKNVLSSTDSEAINIEPTNIQPPIDSINTSSITGNSLSKLDKKIDDEKVSKPGSPSQNDLAKIKIDESNIKSKEISDKLGGNIIEYINSVYIKNKSTSNLIEKISLKEFKRVNFSNDFGAENDYVVTAEYETDFWKDNRSVLLVFIRENNKFNLKYEFNRQPTTIANLYDLIDFDSDGKKELIKNFYAYGNSGYYKRAVEVLKYRESKFDEVFSQDLESGSGMSPFSYKNTYKFTADANNPKLMNIVFNIETVFNGELVKAAGKRIEDYPEEKRKTVKDEIIYKFDGNKFIPNKNVYNFNSVLGYQNESIPSQDGSLQLILEKSKLVKTVEDYKASDYPLLALIPDKNIYMFGKKPTGIDIYVNGTKHEYNWPYMTPRFILPEILLSDFNADGKEELAVILYIGSGTGVSVEDLHIIDLNNFSDNVYKYKDYIEKLESIVNIDVYEKDSKLFADVVVDSKKYELYLKGISAADKEMIRNKSAFGNIVRFQFINNKIQAEFGLGLTHSKYATPFIVGTVKADVSYNSGVFSMNNFSFEADKEYIKP